MLCKINSAQSCLCAVRNTSLPLPEQIEFGAAGAITVASIFVFTTMYAFFGYFVGRDDEWDWTTGDF